MPLEFRYSTHSKATMMGAIRLLAFMLAAVAVLLLVGCDENLAPPPIDYSQYQPQNVSAVATNRSTISLRWTLPPLVSDTALSGYRIDFAGRSQTVSKISTFFAATALLPGPVTFTIVSVGNDGQSSPPSFITWAPAERFDSAFVLYEYDVSALSRNAGLDVGGSTGNPSTVPVALAAQKSMDLYLYGAAGSALTIRGAALFNEGWNVTVFSTVSHSASSLDYFLTSFPAQQTFTLQQVPVRDNTIYYATVVGDNPGDRNTIRIHIKTLGGQFPNRSVQISLSLQRVPGVPYAAADRVHPGRSSSLVGQEPAA